jgi:hypothetical protein
MKDLSRRGLGEGEKIVVYKNRKDGKSPLVWLTAEQARRGDRLVSVQALDEIRDILSGRSWSPDTLEEIADVIRSTGRKVEELEEI